MQVLRLIPGGRRISEGAFHLILPPLGDLGWIVGCNVVEIGACLGAGLGWCIPGCRVAGGGMCGRYSVRLYISKQRTDMLGRSMYHTSSSTIMHQVLGIG